MLCPILRFVSKTGPGRRFPGVMQTGLVAFLLLLGAPPGDAQPVVRQVLVLQSFDRGNVAVDQFTNNFRVELDQRVERARERCPGRRGSNRVCRRA